MSVKRPNDSTSARWFLLVDKPAHLGQLLPKLVKVGEDLGVDFGATDAVDVSQDTQNPSPQDKR